MPDAAPTLSDADADAMDAYARMQAAQWQGPPRPYALRAKRALVRSDDDAPPEERHVSGGQILFAATEEARELIENGAAEEVSDLAGVYVRRDGALLLLGHSGAVAGLQDRAVRPVSPAELEVLRTALAPKRGAR